MSTSGSTRGDSGPGRGFATLRPFLAPLIGFIILIGMADPVSAHARLEATVPAAGETVTEPLAVVQLTYSEPIEETFSDVQVFDPSGTRVDGGSPTIKGPDVAVSITMTVDGVYTVVFRVIGVDGHPVESRYTFIYAPAPAATTSTPLPASAPPTASEPIPEPSERATEPAPATPTPTTPTPTATPTPSESAEDVLAAPTPDPSPAQSAGSQIDPSTIELQDAGAGTDIGLLAARVTDYLALVLLTGGLLGAGWMMAGDRPGLSTVRHLRHLSVAAAIGLVIAAGLMFVFGLSSASAVALPQALDPALVARFAGTRFGTLVLIQAGIGLAIAAVATIGRRSAVVTAGALTAVAALMPSLWGHAGTTQPIPLAVAVDWIHVIGAAVWIGGLAILVLTLMTRDPTDAVDPTRRYSRLAGIAVWLVLASGIGSAILHIGSLDQLTNTRYGQLVIAKAALFVVIAAMGWRNRALTLPRLWQGPTTASASAFRRFAVAEVGVMVLALGVAGGLASSVPAKADAAGRIDFVVASLGEETSVNVTLEPAKPGSNVMHVYVLGRDGRPRQVDAASMRLTRNGNDIPVELLLSGPGHYTVLDQRIPSAGEYVIHFTVAVDGAERRATAALVVR